MDLFEIIDNIIMGTYGITEEEYDYMAANMSDAELEFFCDITLREEDEPLTFAEKRKLIELRKKYIDINR